jgi:hypothetical protein
MAEIAEHIEDVTCALGKEQLTLQDILDEDLATDTKASFQYNLFSAVYAVCSLR